MMGIFVHITIPLFISLSQFKNHKNYSQNKFINKRKIYSKQQQIQNGTSHPLRNSFLQFAYIDKNKTNKQSESLVNTTTHNYATLELPTLQQTLLYLIFLNPVKIFELLLKILQLMSAKRNEFDPKFFFPLFQLFSKTLLILVNNKLTKILQE